MRRAGPPLADGPATSGSLARPIPCLKCCAHCARNLHARQCVCLCIGSEKVEKLFREKDRAEIFATNDDLLFGNWIFCMSDASVALWVAGLTSRVHRHCQLPAAEAEGSRQNLASTHKIKRLAPLAHSPLPDIITRQADCSSSAVAFHAARRKAKSVSALRMSYTGFSSAVSPAGRGTLNTSGSRCQQP